MLLAALIAFGHFLAFFGLAAALVVQLTLLRNNLNVDIARRIQRADRVVGLAAVLVLVFGLLRVFYFEKGSAYYFGNTFFQLKMLLFVGGGALSLIPTIEFRRWNARLAQGEAPSLDEPGRLRLRRMIHWQLVLIVGILLCASLMARGFGN